VSEKPLWRPDPARPSQLSAFTRQAEQVSGRPLPDYQSLHRWSVDEPETFWHLVWQFTGIIGSVPERPILKDSDRFPGAHWFPGTRLNFAENLLKYRDDQPAILSVVETDGSEDLPRVLTYAELHRQVAAIASYLHDQDVRPGDRVAGWLPNVPETIVAMLATASLGAVWTSCSPDFGAQGALDRFGQVRPKVLFACDGYQYNGKTISIVGAVRQVVLEVPDLSAVVWLDRIGASPEDATQFADLLVNEPAPLTFESRRFEDPLYILYSSGTTGQPKCIVHSIGGTLVQHLKEHRLHVDLTRDDRLFYFTTCGWMMWNWLVSGLATGATLVLFEGAPTHPTPDRLFTLADQLEITIFGTSARFLSAVQNAGVCPRQSHGLSSIRSVLSTGSPLTQEGFEYVYGSIREDVHLASISGGTDIVSCFVLGNPDLPVWSGEIQAAGLGMAVEVWNEDGARVVEEKGELVCTRPFPSCPIGFWNDPADEKFLDAYFRRFPGVWTHGDFAEETTHGGFVIHGRSDAVLNPGGVRIGTAEIYRQVESIEAIAEAICVGQDWQDDVRMVLFVVMQPGLHLTDALRDEIRQNIRSNATPRHVPAKILEVGEIPRTISGKIVELAVREVIHNRPVKNTAALANPAALEQFRNRQELAD
jgi:acetoacetyl-CoA synthetase